MAAGITDVEFEAEITETIALQLMSNLSTMQHPMYCSLEKCSLGSSVDCLYKNIARGFDIFV